VQRLLDVWQTSNLQLLRLGKEIKEEERKKEETTGQNIMVCPIP